VKCLPQAVPASKNYDERKSLALNITPRKIPAVISDNAGHMGCKKRKRNSSKARN
jgi:hypothetical protein